MSRCGWHAAASVPLLIALAACGDHVSAEDFRFIEKDMPREHVIDRLGEPDELSSMGIGDLTGTSARWRGDERMITILFANDRVVFKSLDRVPAEPRDRRSQ